MAAEKMLNYATKCRYLCSGTALAVLVMSLVTPAAGQQSSTASSTLEQPQARVTQSGLEEIVITARKIEESLQKTPVAVTALTAGMLEARNVKDVTDLSAFTPNLVLQLSGVNGSSKTPAIYLRGLGQFDTPLTADPAVGMYIDGVYVSRNTGSIIDLVNIDRVEILRGPQGTLFGKNTIGGAINIITKKPGNDIEASAEITAGNYSRISGKAMINLPLSDTFFFRLSAFGNRQDGYVHLNNYPGREFGDDETIGVRGQVRWLPTSNLTVDLSLDYSSSRNTGAPMVLLDTYPSSLTGTFYNLMFSGDPSCMTPAGQATNSACFGPVQISSDPRRSNAIFFDRSLNKVLPKNNFDILGTSLSIDLQLPFGSLKSISAYRALRSDYSADAALFGDFYWQTILERQDADQFSTELQLTGTSFADRLKWVFGGYFLYEDTSGHATILSAASVAPFLGTTYPVIADNDQTVKTHNYAAFGQITYDLTDWLHITGGLRWTREKKDATLIIRPTVLNGLEGDLTISRVTPMASIGVDLTPDIFAYVSYSEGFRSGGFPPRIVGQTSIIPSYGPEEAKSYEAGLKATFLQNRLRTNLALFTTSYVSFQGFGTRTDLVPPLNTIINAGDARIKGIELEVVAAPSRYFQVDASVSHMTTELTRVDPTLTDNGVSVPLGNRLPYAPSWKAAAGVNWTVPFNDGSNLTLRADISWTSRIYFLLLNETNMSQDSTTLLNGGLTYSFPGDDLQLSVGVKNLTDSFYYTSKSNDSVTIGTLTGVMAPPRTWFATLRWQY